MRRAATLLAFLLALAVPALGQEHGHATGSGGERLVVLHDGPVDGRAVVGGLTHFGFALVDAKGAPVRHEDARFTLVQNGVTIFDSEATHEYDGLFTFEHVFTVPGPYEVRVESSTGASDAFRGVVVPPTAAFPTSIALEVPEGLSPFSLGTVRVHVLDGAGAGVPHSDAILEVRVVGDDFLVYRTHLHAHDAEPMEITLGFVVPAEYEARVVSYLAFPNGAIPDFVAQTATAKFTVAPGFPVARAPSLLGSLDALLRSPGGAGHKSNDSMDHRLTLTMDPEDRNGPMNHQRLSAFVWDNGSMEALQHVNFAMKLRAPDGTVIAESASLHEYDGHFEFLVAGLPPGAYSWDVEASHRTWEDSASAMFLILPPAAPYPAAGPLSIEVTGADALVAGVPAELAFAVKNAAGLVVPHSELDLTILRVRDGVPVLATKIHTHDEAPVATIALAEEGDYVLLVDPDTLMPNPVAYRTESGLGYAVALPLAVGAGPGLPLPLDVEGADASEPLRALPGAPLVLLALALAVGSLLARR